MSKVRLQLEHTDKRWCLTLRIDVGEVDDLWLAATVASGDDPHRARTVAAAVADALGLVSDGEGWVHR